MSTILPKKAMSEEDIKLQYITHAITFKWDRGKISVKVYTHISFDDAEEELKLMKEFRKAQAEIEKKSDAKAVSQKMFKVV